MEDTAILAHHTHQAYLASAPRSGLPSFYQLYCWYIGITAQFLPAVPTAVRHDPPCRTSVCQKSSHSLHSRVAVWNCTVSLDPKPICMLCRYGLLAGCALFQGATLGPLVKIVLATHPGVLVTAFLGTSTIFACFSAAALLSRRRR